MSGTADGDGASGAASAPLAWRAAHPGPSARTCAAAGRSSSVSRRRRSCRGMRACCSHLRPGGGPVGACAARAGQRGAGTDVHRAAAADALAAGAAERERGVDLVLDFDQRVQHHRPALVQVDLVVLHAWSVAAVRVPAVDREGLHVGRRRGLGAAHSRGGAQQRRRMPPQRGATRG